MEEAVMAENVTVQEVEEEEEEAYQKSMEFIFEVALETL